MASNLVNISDWPHGSDETSRPTVSPTNTSLTLIQSTTNSTEELPATIAGDTSSYYSSIEFYFQVAVVVITFVGSIANGIVLYALIFSPGNKKNVLLINQTIIDFYSSVLLLVTYIVKLCNIYLVGTLGFWLCILLTGEQIAWFGINASMLNIGVITIERYLMIVHSVWHKNHFRQWMAYVGCAFPWASSILMNLLLYYFTSDISDGKCLAVVFWYSKGLKVFFGVWYYVHHFQLPLCLFIFCYSRILAVIRRQNRVFQSKKLTSAAAANSQGDANQKASRSEMNALRTMIILTTFFTLFWMPNNLYYLILNVSDDSLNLLNNGWYATVFIAFLNICVNPIVYVASYDDVKIFLGQKFGCRRIIGGSTASQQQQQQHSISRSQTTAGRAH